MKIFAFLCINNKFAEKEIMKSILFTINHTNKQTPGINLAKEVDFYKENCKAGERN